MELRWDLIFIHRDKRLRSLPSGPFHSTLIQSMLCVLNLELNLEYLDTKAAMILIVS